MSIPGVTKAIVPSSKTRRQLTITIDVGIGYVTCNGGDPPGSGLSITPASPLQLDWARHGEMVTRAWFGSVSAAGAQLGVMNVEDVF